MSCPSEADLGEYKAGLLDQREHQKIEEHLGECRPCQAYLIILNEELAEYSKRADEQWDGILAGISASDVKVSVQRPRWYRLWGPISATASVMAGLVLFMVFRQDPSSTRFYARGAGSEDSGVQLFIYRVPSRGMSEPVTSAISASDYLAFAYQNGAKKKYLMIYGIDEQGSIHWYHPEWKSEQDNPRAVSAKPTPGIHELAGAVSHDLGGGKVSVTLLFLDRALSVREAERGIKKANQGETPKLLQGAVKKTLILDITN